MKATLVLDSKSILGEGPVWHQGLQCLFWVDIEGKRIHKLDSKSRQTEAHQFGQMAGATVPIDDTNLLISFDNGLAAYNWLSKKIEYKNQLGKDAPKIPANDGKCDPNGNFWIGTIHLDLEPYAGELYRFDNHLRLTKQISDRTISNGLSWTKDGSVMYYIDTWGNAIVAYDFDIDTNQISNKRVVVKIRKDQGEADGMTIDNNDTLWVAHWGGSCVRQWDTKTDKILDSVHLPVPHVTSCTFGGAAYHELYITTAQLGLSTEQLLKYPLSGGIFKVKLGIIGRPANFFQPHIL